MLSETDAEASGGAAATSLTCCIELAEANPRPQTATEIAILLALPGVPPEQIELQLDDSGVLVRAERHSSASGRAARIRRLEIPYGCFERRIALPQGRYELTEQSCVNGILQLRLRKH